MREKYVEFVKEYITSLPDYRNAIHDMRENVLKAGATEEEFEEALKQVAELEAGVASKRGHLIKRLIQLDIAAHVTVLAVFGVLGTLYFVLPAITGNMFDIPFTQFLSKKQQPVSILEPTPKPIANLKAYAKTQPINAQQIFSFPASPITLAITGRPKREVYGFFPYWMLEVEDKISLNTLTTIGVFGLEVDGSGNIITANNDSLPDKGWEMWNDKRLTRFLNRAKRRSLKIELVLKSFNNSNIEHLVLSDESHRTFLSNAIQLLNLKALSGINLDFEYNGEIDPKIRDSFTRFVINLRTEMKRKIPNATLTLSTYIHSASVPRLFDVEQLSEYVDAFIIMGYDAHTPLGSPGPIAPMEGELGIIGSVQSYLEKVPPEKLILGIPYYGYDWPVPAGTSKEEVKTVPYAQIAQNLKGSTIKWDEITQTPWYDYIDKQTGKTRHVYFDDPRSLGIKYDYVDRKNLKGIAIWALGYDGLNSDLRQVIIEKFAN